MRDYEIKRFYQYGEEGPEYSFQGKRAESKDNGSPGPGAYDNDKLNTIGGGNHNASVRFTQSIPQAKTPQKPFSLAASLEQPMRGKLLASYQTQKRGKKTRTATKTGQKF